MSDNNITTENLANNIKGLGPQKANMIKNFLDNEDEISVGSLASLQGVSTALARRVVAYIETHTEPVEPETEPEDDFDWDDEPDEPLSGSVKVSSNGHETTLATHTAGEVRRFAREAESFGYREVAEELRTTVRALLDNETVTL